MTNEQIKQIVALRNAGYGYDAVAQETGISKSTISSFCKKNGLAGRTRNIVEGTEKNDLNCAPDRGNVGDGKKPVAPEKARRAGNFKVTVSFAEKPNEAALAEALRILTNVR